MPTIDLNELNANIMEEMEQDPVGTEVMTVDNAKTDNNIENQSIHSSESEEELKASMSDESGTNFDETLFTFETDSDFENSSDDDEEYTEVHISDIKQNEALNGKIVYPKLGEKVEPLVVPERASTKYSLINYGVKDFDGIKISSWSICGAQKFIEKKGHEFFKHDTSDIYCLQDFNCSIQEFQKLKSYFLLDGYNHYWLMGDGTQGVRTRGLGILTKMTPTSQKVCQTGVALLDNELTILITEFEEFMLLNVTAPSAGFGLVHLQTKLLWHNAFNKFIGKLTENISSKPVIIVGNLQTSIEEIGKILSLSKLNQNFRF